MKMVYVLNMLKFNIRDTKVRDVSLMREYGFSLTRILFHKDRIYDAVIGSLLLTAKT